MMPKQKQVAFRQLLGQIRWYPQRGQAAGERRHRELRAQQVRLEWRRGARKEPVQAVSSIAQVEEARNTDDELLDEHG